MIGYCDRQIRGERCGRPMKFIPALNVHVCDGDHDFGKCSECGAERSLEYGMCSICAYPAHPTKLERRIVQVEDNVKEVVAMLTKLLDWLEKQNGRR